jgi:hypothetical protein
MTYEHFSELCENSSIRPDSSDLPSEPLLLALWHDHRGHWVIAHRVAQSVNSVGGSIVHAYLHREEGDLSNAQYWYGRAGRPMPDMPLESEWEQLAKEFCENT